MGCPFATFQNISCWNVQPIVLRFSQVAYPTSNVTLRYDFSMVVWDMMTSGMGDVLGTGGGKQTEGRDRIMYVDSCGNCF